MFRLSRLPDAHCIPVHWHHVPSVCKSSFLYVKQRSSKDVVIEIYGVNPSATFHEVERVVLGDGQAQFFLLPASPLLELETSLTHKESFSRIIR